MTQTEAFAAFLARSGLPVFAAGDVPEEAADTAPDGAYITFAAAEGVWGQTIALTADLWAYGSRRRAGALAREILRRCGRGGCLLPCDGGALWLLPGSPPLTALTDGTVTGLCRYRLNFTSKNYTESIGMGCAHPD